MLQSTEKIVEQITEKRKMTSEVKSGIYKRIMRNGLAVLGMILYMVIINIGYIFANVEVTAILMKVFAMVAIVLTVAVFEVAYRKDSGKITIVGMEMLVFSIIVLYIPQIYANFDKKFCVQMIFIPSFCAVYYIAKCIIIYIKTEKHYQNNLSDVKEIIKED